MDGSDAVLIPLLHHLQMEGLPLDQLADVDAFGDGELHLHGGPLPLGDGLVGDHQGTVGQIDAFNLALGPHLSGAYCRHALEVRIDDRLGVEQELGRADYAVTRFHPRLDGDLVAKLGAESDGDRLEVAIPQRQHQPILTTGADHRFAWHHQLRLSLACLNRHLGKHIGFQKLVRVVKAQPHLEGASSGIQGRIEVIHLTLPAAAGGIVESHGDRIPHFQLGGLTFEHLGAHPHLL